MYADDIVLFATSCQQTSRMVAQLAAILSAISLRLSLPKCKFLKGCHVVDDELRVHDQEVGFVQRFVFLGILITFSVSCKDVLLHRLGWARCMILSRVLQDPLRESASVKKRLQLLDTFITRKWRWMAPALRPVTAVRKTLDSLHLTYVSSIVRPQSDPFLSPSGNWITQHRAARMAAHVVGHTAWSIVQVKQFFSYWGHAARLPLGGARPVRLAMEVFGVQWTAHLEGLVRRQVGFWRNTVRFLQLEWARLREMGEPESWVDAAQDRNLWKLLWNKWLLAKGCLAVGMSHDPWKEDLMGR